MQGKRHHRAAAQRDYEFAASVVGAAFAAVSPERRLLDEVGAQLKAAP